MRHLVLLGTILITSTGIAWADTLSFPPIVSGIVVGLLTSAPDAIITKAYAPILVTGIVFGALAGWIVGYVPSHPDAHRSSA